MFILTGSMHVMPSHKRQQNLQLINMQQINIRNNLTTFIRGFSQRNLVECGRRKGTDEDVVFRD